MRCIVQAADGGICEATCPGEQEAGQEGAPGHSASLTQDHLQGNYIPNQRGQFILFSVVFSPLPPQQPTIESIDMQRIYCILL